MIIFIHSLIRNIILFSFLGSGSLLVVSAEIADLKIFSLSGSSARSKVLSLKHPEKLLLKINEFQYSHCMAKKYANRTDTVPASNQKTHEMLQSIRSGGIVTRNHRLKSNSMHSSLQQKSKNAKKNQLLFISCVAFYALIETRSAWMDLFDKERLQASVVQSLENLNNFPYLYSRSIYAISMGLWETLGMSTIPVETAAGMVFGWSGFYWSAIGKLLGACLAFGLGRGALSPFVEKKLSTNEFLNLVQTSTEENPLLVVILIKLSCFPETVKNFGSSMLKPIRWWMFVSSTAVHGWTFTALWTYLGVDTAARLKDTDNLLPPDDRLKVLLALAFINGIVVSPLSMFYWMRTLKQKQNDSKGRRVSRNESD